jgi:hypothetical protein
MKNVKESKNEMTWRLVWDTETKDVLFIKQLKCDIETENELFTSKNKTDIYDKIVELGLKYDPSVEENYEWM